LEAPIGLERPHTEVPSAPPALLTRGGAGVAAITRIVKLQKNASLRVDPRTTTSFLGLRG